MSTNHQVLNELNEVCLSRAATEMCTVGELEYQGRETLSESITAAGPEILVRKAEVISQMFCAILLSQRMCSSVYFSLHP